MTSPSNFRHELKYFINHYDSFILRNKLRHIIPRDEHTNKQGEYHIRSLYFDNFSNTSLFEKQIGILKRKKYRIRIYNLSDKIIKLEKKSRVGQYINKKSIIISRKQADDILSQNYSFLKDMNDSLALEFYTDLICNLYRPKVLVDYIREPYMLNLSKIRITFDRFLKTGLECTDLFNKNLPAISAVDEPFDILEIKYNNFLPSYIISSIQAKSPSMKSAISKYVYCRKFNKKRLWEDH